MATADGYRRTAWDCLKLAEGASSRETRSSLVNLAQEWVKLAKQSERNDQHKLRQYREKGYAAWARGYRARAQECVALAQGTIDPEHRTELLSFAQLWMSLAEPTEIEARGAFELPPRN